MKRWAAMLLLAIFVTALAPLPAGAQDAGAPLPLEVVETRTSKDGVTFVISVPRALVGRDLPASAFSVTEGGEPREPTASRLTNDALEVVLLVDTSGSMRGAPLVAAQQAANAFIDSMPNGIKIGAVSFGTVPIVVGAMGSSHDQLKAAVGALVARGETALYDGLIAATTQLSTERKDIRRAIVVLSDGGDTVSTGTLAGAAEAVKTSGAELFSIALITPEADLGALQELAKRTGGRVVPADDASALTSVYQSVAAGLVNRYEVSFHHQVGGPTELTVGVDFAGVKALAKVAVVLPRVNTSAPTVVADTGPKTVLVQDPGLLASSGARQLGLAAMFAALLIIGLLVIRPVGPRRRLASEVGSAVRDRGDEQVRDIARRASVVADRLLESNDRGGRLNARLERAGLSIRPGELVVAVAVAATVAALIGLLVGKLLGAIILAGLVVLGVMAWLTRRTERRQKTFADQLSDNLLLLSGNLRVGHGVLQSLDGLAREADWPSDEEFRRVVTEQRLGRDLNESFRAMVDRVGSEDLRWVAEAIEIHREVGGDLAEVLDKVAATIRDRDSVRRTIAVLTAEGRFSAYVLTALPFAGFLFITLINPEYGDLLTGTTAGHVALISAGGLMLVGWLWLRRLIRLVF